VRTSNVAIVFTDIKGFSERTGRQSHEENKRMLRLHDALLMPVFRAFDGRLVKTIGDAFLVVFPSPTRAVLCGVAIQDRLWDYNRRVPAPDQIHVRVAINLGEVREEKGDVFGEPVNIAARVETIAEAGEVLFTEAIYLAMNKAEVPAEEAGTHQLKGISTPIRVWRVPRGQYKLEAAPPEGEQAPYGGLGLSRAGRLPPSDPESLSKETEIVPQLLARAGALQRAATGVLPRLRQASSPVLKRVQQALRPAVSKVRTWWARIPERRRWPILVGAAAAIVALAYFLGRGDEVERAVERGDVRGARALLQKMPPGSKRTYDEGRIEEARGAFGTAASRYASAAKGGDRRGWRRLIRMTKNDRCRARESAARSLGGLGDRDAISALESLENGSFPDEGEDSLIGQVFSCSSRRAARDALQRLRAGD
jgi:class 3 adenylate cyclase